MPLAVTFIVPIFSISYSIQITRMKLRWRKSENEGIEMKIMIYMCEKGDGNEIRMS